MASSFVLNVEARDVIEPNEVVVSPRMRRILERAAEIARARTGHSFIGTENVLRALTEEPDGIAGQVLNDLGVIAPVRARLDEIMASAEYAKGWS